MAIEKRKAYLQSDRGKQVRKRANDKWRKSEKGKAYRKKENEILRKARELIRAEKEAFLERLREQTKTPPLTPRTESFIEWCTQEGEAQAQQFREETLAKRKQHNRDYFDSFK